VQDSFNRSPAVTVSGCVAQAQRTGSLSDDTGTSTAVTPNTTGVEANSAEPLSGYVLLNATPASSGSSADGARAERTSYALQGHESELATHRGHRVEVVGYLVPLPGTASSKTIAAGTRRIAVQSIKMLETRCPVDTPKPSAEKSQ